MKIRKREELEALIAQNGLKKKQEARGQAVKTDNAGHASDGATRVEVSAGEFLNKIAQGPSNSEKVQLLKKIIAEEGISGLNARYASEDVAGALASELSSFINDFSERE